MAGFQVAINGRFWVATEGALRRALSCGFTRGNLSGKRSRGQRRLDDRRSARNSVSNQSRNSSAVRNGRIGNRYPL